MLDAPVALVSPDEFVSVVRVYADRCNDLLRRAGCSPVQAAEIVESTALDLLDTLVSDPDSVVDLAGWWFGRALAVARGVTGGAPVSAEGAGGRLPAASVLAGTSGERQARAALDRMAERDRLTLLLRDAYHLPTSAVAVALGQPDAVGTTDAALAAARLRFVAEYDGREIPTVAGHAGRPGGDASALSRLADGTLSGPPAVALRRHAGRCPACGDVAESAAKARRVVSGLPVAALADEDRDGLLDRVGSRAHDALSGGPDGFFAAEDEPEPRPLVSPALVAATIALALAVGILVGLLSGRSSGHPAALVVSAPSTQPTAAATPSATPTPTPSPTPTRTPSPTPSPSASRPAAPVAPPPTAAPSRTPAPVPVGPADITVNPASGPNGTSVAVTGQGFRPGTTVLISYRDPLGRPTGSRTVATVTPDGTFTSRILAEDPSGSAGTHIVDARDGHQDAQATFTAT